MTDSRKNEIFYSLAQAGNYAHVTRQAILLAINNGQLKAKKQRVRDSAGKMRKSWVIHRKDLDEYRASRYISDKRTINGEKVFDLSEDRWSVIHVAKTLSMMLNRPIHTSMVYYMLRTGQMRASKKGKSWIISQQEMLKLHDRILKKDNLLQNSL